MAAIGGGNVRAVIRSGVVGTGTFDEDGVSGVCCSSLVPLANGTESTEANGTESSETSGIDASKEWITRGLLRQSTGGGMGDPEASSTADRRAKNGVATTGGTETTDTLRNDTARQCGHVRLKRRP